MFSSSIQGGHGGTVLAARKVLDGGIAINIGGGYHRAKPKRGGVLCLFNDIAIAIRVLKREGLVNRVLVIDLDFHQGDGTAVCFDSDSTVYTFSMQQNKIYPLQKGPLVESDLFHFLQLGRHLARVQIAVIEIPVDPWLCGIRRIFETLLETLPRVERTCERKAQEERSSFQD
jgi:hypothetical protein